MAQYITRGTDIRRYESTITPASVATIVSAEQTFTVNGLATTDAVFISPPATGNGTMVGTARVSAANTIAITYTNPTAGNLTPAAGIVRILAVRF